MLRCHTSMTPWPMNSLVIKVNGLQGHGPEVQWLGQGQKMALRAAISLTTSGLSMR